MTLPRTRSVVATTRLAPSRRSHLSLTQSLNIVLDRVLVRPSTRGLSRAGILPARLRSQAAAALVPRYSDSHDELARLRPLLARPPAGGCTRALRSLRARAFGPVALSSRRVVMIPLLSRYLPSRLRCTSLLDTFHSLAHDDVI
ncbi:hypothetical protein EV715DRAFT_275007 [Schizophyllum commune]